MKPEHVVEIVGDLVALKVALQHLYLEHAMHQLDPKGYLEATRSTLVAQMKSQTFDGSSATEAIRLRGEVLLDGMFDALQRTIQP